MKTYRFTNRSGKIFNAEILKELPEIEEISFPVNEDTPEKIEYLTDAWLTTDFNRIFKIYEMIFILGGSDIDENDEDHRERKIIAIEET